MTRVWLVRHVVMTCLPKTLPVCNKMSLRDGELKWRRWPQFSISANGGGPHKTTQFLTRCVTKHDRCACPFFLWTNVRHSPLIYFMLNPRTTDLDFDRKVCEQSKNNNILWFPPPPSVTKGFRAEKLLFKEGKKMLNSIPTFNVKTHSIKKPKNYSVTMFALHVIAKAQKQLFGQLIL